MYIDFHTHGKLAKKLPFSKTYTDLMFEKAHQRGLDAICLTEHFNTLSFDVMYDYIYNKYQHSGDCIITDHGLLVFFGMEVDIYEGGHTLVIGRYDDIVELNQKLDNHKTKETFLPFDKLVLLLENYDILFGAGHPFRQGGNIPKLTSEQLQHFDFFDLNGKDLANDSKQTKRLVYNLAKQYHKPVLSGSDTHQGTQYGCVKTNFKNSFNTLSELRNEIKKGNYQIEIADSIKIQVEDATIQKRLLKEVHRLGGDYVSLL
ncbi:PHP domain-containing protein [uncultured Thomasclavelia sp.]|uniref:PHP domain-containing protein n=1 Tax=uncultured Thomasclavelia sp. TaxID=3025759 RepID=UPI0025F34D32|nr:PHP-associated domain-containing protein [uncultured Thomasclavelia sp.]